MTDLSFIPCDRRAPIVLPDEKRTDGLDEAVSQHRPSLDGAPRRDLLDGTAATRRHSLVTH